MTIITTLLNDPGIQRLTSFLFQSILILGFTTLLITVLRSRISSTTAHLLWLGGFCAIALLPLGKAITSTVQQQWQYLGEVSVITITAAGPVERANSAEIAPALILALYALIVCCLLARLLMSALELRRLDQSSIPLDDDSVNQQFQQICHRLGITRQVTLKTGDRINSPFAYGWRTPTVLVPRVITEWSEPTREDVFVHELSHIRRLDWLTLIFTHLLSSLLWLNPLTWLANRRLHDEAEQACDSAVVSLGRDRIGYAEELLSLAKARRAKYATPLLAQPMYDHKALTTRIKNILDGKISRKITRSALAGLAGMVVLMAVTGSGIQLIAAENARDQEYLPIKTEIPQYPTQAAEAGIEGWILLSFTVTTDGTVDADSIAIVDAEPAGYFERSATRALQQFEFQPRIENGIALEVPGVQYLFRYHLEDEGEPAYSRPPPSPSH